MIIFAPYKYDHIKGLPDLDSVMRDLNILSIWYNSEGIKYTSQIQFCLNHTIILFVLEKHKTT